MASSVAACIPLMSGGWTDAGTKRAAHLGSKVFKKPFKVAEVVEWLQHVQKIISADSGLILNGSPETLCTCRLSAVLPEVAR